MYFPSSSSAQTGITKMNQVLPSASNESTFKTSNPQIFPSLHPCSAFYQQKKNIQSNSHFTGHMEPQQPVKKVKVDNVSGGVTMSLLKKEKVNAKGSDQDAFRVPKLPRRLMQNKTQISQEKNQKELLTQRLPGFESATGSLVVPDIVAQNLRDFQSYPINAQTERQIINEKLFPQIQIPSLRINEGTTFVNNWQSQNSEAFSPALNPLMINALYERFKLDYLNLQFKQNLLNMYQNSRQNMQLNW